MLRRNPAQPGASRSTHDARCSAFLPGLVADLAWSNLRARARDKAADAPELPSAGGRR